MLCATSHVSARLTGHSSSSGVSIQSRISPNRERCSRWKIFMGSGGAKRSTRDLLEAIAQAAHRGNADRALLDLLAQAMDVDLDRVVAHLFAPFAQPLD